MSVRAVIVGTGRSGSGYISEALTACGIPCGHEEVYTARGYAPIGMGARSHLLVDSSWMAICWPDHLPPLVWHQVRHPEAVIRSRITAPLNAHQGIQGRLKERWLPFTGDPVIDAMRWYVTWNLACERYAEHAWQVEDVDGDLIEDLAARLALPVPDTCPLDVIPPTVNRHTDNTTWTLDDLPPGADRDAVLALGERYGYDL